MNYEIPPVSVVHGDWLPEDHPGYPALITGRWNGFAVPSFDFATAKQVVADQVAMLGDNAIDAVDIDVLSFVEGDRIKVTPAQWPDQVDEPFYIGPGANGRYVIDLGWCWYDDITTDPAAPSVAQLAVFRGLQSAGTLDGGSSHGLTVLANGAHRFPVYGDLTTEHRVLVGTLSHHRIQVGSITIDRDGNIEREDVTA